MAESIIVDRTGQPFKKADLVQEIAAPTLTGIRYAWNAETMASGLTPTRLATLLRDAAINDPRNYLTLAEEMEERDLHYAAVLGTRKRGVSGLTPVVEAAGETDDQLKQAQDIRDLVKNPAFGELLDDALDALGKGFSVVEIMWSKGEKWTPEQFIWRDPRFFRFDQADPTKLRLLTDTNAYPGDPLQPYKFIVHMPRLKSGIPIRGGLARLVAAAYMCKAYAVTDWVAFSEVFGMPLRLGRYGPGATEGDISKLINAVANLGTDAAAVLPDSMRIDFQEAGNRTGGGDLFKGLAEYLDRLISKAVLGQTASTEGTAGKLGNEQAQAEVRADIQIADARALCDTINRDLVKPYIDLNYGPQKSYPRITLPVVEPDDLSALATNLKTLTGVNLRIPASWVRDRFGIPDPNKDDELLSVAAQPATVTSGADTTGAAMNRAQGANQANAETDIVGQQLDQAQEQGDQAILQWIDEIHSAVDQASSLEDLRDRLLDLWPKMNPGQFGQVMTEAMIAAQMSGRSEILDGN